MSDLDCKLSPARKIALVGAGGFVGSRFMHILRQRGSLEYVGIVRSVRSLARLSNAPMETRVVHTSKVSELAEALAGCGTAINLIYGDLLRALAETQTVYEAARLAGCKRFIHLSSAVVFGRAESGDLVDDSKPQVHNWNLYARGKAQAEVYLKNAMSEGAMRVVVLRPGLIWGPGSPWVHMAGDQLSHGAVCLSNSGKGIANLVHVDNLVSMMLAVHSKPSGPSGFYNVSDAETVTWRDYYEGIAERLGYPIAHVRTWPDARLPLSPKLAMEWCLQQRFLFRAAKWLLPHLGTNTKAFAKKLLKGEVLPPEANPVAPIEAPRLTRERWDLQNTPFRLPTKKFMSDYGPLKLVSFEDALDSAAAWLRFAGYGANGLKPQGSLASNLW